MYQIKIQNSVDTIATQAVYDEQGVIVTEAVDKSAEEISDEEQALKDSKSSEIQSKVDAYKAAQEYQRQNGGPGPVADFETMKIVNQYNGQFEVAFKE